MSHKILIIGANSALAKVVIPVLKTSNTVITAGKTGCDVQCDITEELSLPKVDVVINFAAAFSGTSDEAIIAAQKTNVAGTLNVCVAAKKAGAKHIINISSIFALLDTNSPHYSVYALTKRQGDELAQLYCRLNKIPLAVVRPSQIYGDDDSFAKHQRFFYEIINKAQAGQDIEIYGQHDALRNYIHAADLAETINRIVTKCIEGVYPCLNLDDVTLSQIAHTAQQVFGQGGKVTFVKDKPDTPDNIFAKDMSIYKKIDYQPGISLEAGIERIKNYREGARP